MIRFHGRVVWLPNPLGVVCVMVFMRHGYREITHPLEERTAGPYASDCSSDHVEGNGSDHTAERAPLVQMIAYAKLAGHRPRQALGRFSAKAKAVGHHGYARQRHRTGGNHGTQHHAQDWK